VQTVTRVIVSSVVSLVAPKLSFGLNLFVSCGLIVVWIIIRDLQPPFNCRLYNKSFVSCGFYVLPIVVVD
jgi:hypothetical protein